MKQFFAIVLQDIHTSDSFCRVTYIYLEQGCQGEEHGTQQIQENWTIH